MTTSNQTSKPSFLLDTGPLSVLCGFPRQGPAYLNVVLTYAEVALADGVIAETRAETTGKIGRTVSPLVKAGKIRVVTAPAAPVILDTAYGKDLGLGERSTIKAALATGFTPVIDDKNGFIAACRFGLRPIGFQDLIVRLVKERNMPKQMGIEIVKATAGQYLAMFLIHTLDMLS